MQLSYQVTNQTTFKLVWMHKTTKIPLKYSFHELLLQETIVLTRQRIGERDGI